MVTRIWIFGALLGILSLPLHGATATAAVVPSSEAAQTVVVNDLTVPDGSVSGTVVNKSSATVRGVALLLRQTWLWNDERHPGTDSFFSPLCATKKNRQWKDERHPGTDSPGRTLPFTLGADVAPNASAPFTFQTPPLAQRSDGRFVTTMDVTGFSEVGP